MDKLRTGQAFIPLTALWAFVESGLGGLMHALHIPFTGIVLGGFSIIIISVIALNGHSPFQNIMKATLVVLAVKASVNPGTPPMAYLAVSFQGLCGALLFSVPRRLMITMILLGVITMLESALQKLLVPTILYGKAWLKALDAFYSYTMQQFGIDSKARFSLWVVYAYLGIYLVWGLVLGIWMYYLPSQLDRRANLYKDLQPVQPNIVEVRKKKKRGMALMIFAVLICISTFFLQPGKNSALSTLVVIFRTITIVLLLVYVVLPLWKIFVTRKLAKAKSENLKVVLDFMPRISGYVQPLYRHVSANFKGALRLKELVLGLIVISLHLDDAP